MIISAAIISQNQSIFCSNHLPCEVKLDIARHADKFLNSINKQDDDAELPFIETNDLRYIYKQTEDLYWVLVTKRESDLLIDINLLGKFICTIMEYGPSETNSLTLTAEQQDLFYIHIWRPWDDDETSPCSSCKCHCNLTQKWGQELQTRLEFLISIRDGNVDESDVRYFNGLISECWSINAQFSTSWNKVEKIECDSESGSLCSENSLSSISEEKLIDGCRLKCRLEDLRLEISRLQDPYLRLFARRNLLTEDELQTGLVSTAPSLKDLDPDVDSDF